MLDGCRVLSVEGVDESGKQVNFRGDYFISTMPVRELISEWADSAPPDVIEVSNGLIYRDFITVGLLAKKLSVTEKRRRSTQR